MPTILLLVLLATASASLVISEVADKGAADACDGEESAAAGALLCICLACHRAKGLFQYDSDEEDDLMGGGKRGKKGRKARKYDDDDDEQELSASPPKKVLELQADVLEG